MFDWALINFLVNKTITLGNRYLQNELQQFLNLVHYPHTHTVVGNVESRHRRETYDWNTPSGNLDIISTAAERQEDIRNFPDYRGYLWRKVLGNDEGKEQIYLEAAAGLFAGINFDNCNFKLFGKAIVRAHVLGLEGDIVSAVGKYEHFNGTIGGRAYVKFAGYDLFNEDISPPFTRPFPESQHELFDRSYILIISGFPIILEFSAEVTLWQADPFCREPGWREWIRKY